MQQQHWAINQCRCEVKSTANSCWMQNRAQHVSVEAASLKQKLICEVQSAQLALAGCPIRSRAGYRKVTVEARCCRMALSATSLALDTCRWVQASSNLQRRKLTIVYHSAQIHAPVEGLHLPF